MAVEQLKRWWGEYRSTKQAAGVVVLLLNVVIIVASAQFTQYVFKDVDYYKPLFFTYFNGFFMTILLWRPLVYYVYEIRSQRRVLTHGDLGQGLLRGGGRIFDLDECSATPEQDRSLDVQRACGIDLWIVPSAKQRRLMFRHMRFTLWPLIRKLGLLWFVSNWIYSWSLALTSVSSNQILYQSTTLFAYLLSIWLLNEKASWLKSSSAFLCIGGVVLITWIDVDTSDESVFESSELVGDLLAVVGSFLFALYLTLFKKMCMETTDTEFECFVYFGMIGILCGVLAWPLLLLFHYTSWEVFEWPSTFELVAFMILNASIATIFSNYFYALGVLWTSPLMANLVNSFTVPLAILSDAVLRGSTFSPLYIVGMLLIFISFITVTVAEAREEAGAKAQSLSNENDSAQS